jgi:hypothetical protein
MRLTHGCRALHALNKPAARSYLCCIAQNGAIREFQEFKMNKRSKISAFFGTIGSAINVAAAVEGRQKVSTADLRNLGIDPIQFERIRR